MQKKCESCKVEFARGSIVCIPQDVAVLPHKERYFYPKKDEKGKSDDGAYVEERSR